MAYARVSGSPRREEHAVDEIDVRLAGVEKRFGDTVAVNGIDLEIERGAFFSLLGPSGCGKTTTLRMLGGFEEPDEGTIELGGKDVTGIPPHRRDVNTVFQSYALFPHLDVFENVAYGLRRRHVAKNAIEERVREMLRLVDLPGLERRRPGQLSGGQQQRVALARALVNHPQVLLLDEPLGALDLKLRKQMQLELKRIQREVGITFVYVTHDQEEAMTMSDRIAVMRSGNIEQVGPPEEMYEHPATEFVAGFLGTSNLLRGTVERYEGDQVVVALASGERAGAPGGRKRATPGSAIRIGVRPEKIRISPGDATPEPGRNAVSGVLQVATYVGVSHQYAVETTTGETVTVYAQNLGAAGEYAPRAGEQVVLTWHPEHTFIVEREEQRA